MLFSTSAPSRAPDIITAHNSSSTSLIVAWSHLPKQNFSGEPLGYKVTYHPVGLKKNVNIVIVNYTNTTELANLSAFTVYIIDVSALSSGGVGPGNTAKARTNDAGTNDLLSANIHGMWARIGRESPGVECKVRAHVNSTFLAEC